MRDCSTTIVFGWYPYLCLTVFLLGSLLRFDREQYTWRTGSSQLLRRRQLMWGSNLFHVGILVIFAGHFVGLLTPIWVFDALGISHTLQAAAGDRRRRHRRHRLLDRHRAAGASAPVRRAHPHHLLVRRHRDPAAAVRAADCSGLPPSRSRCGHLDGHEMVKFMSWAQGILTLQPGVAGADRRRQPDLQGAPVPGHDDLPGLSVHPAGARLERAGLVSRPPRLSGRAQP